MGGWIAAAGPSKGQPCWRALVIEIQPGQATPPLPSPTQYIVLLPLPSVSAYSLCPTWRGQMVIRGFKEHWYQCLSLSTIAVSVEQFLKVAINLWDILSQSDKGWLWTRHTVHSVLSSQREQTKQTYFHTGYYICHYLDIVLLIRQYVWWGKNDATIVKNILWHFKNSTDHNWCEQ